MFWHSDKENMVAPFGRQATLTMIISYNDSDWTTGWNHLLKGATMFLTPSYEQEWGYLNNLLLAKTIWTPFKTLDPDDSIALNPNEIPVITFRKRRQVRLGPPYGICRPRKPSGLTHFEIYTKKHCFFQCLTSDLNISTSLWLIDYEPYWFSYLMNLKGIKSFDWKIDKIETGCNCTSNLLPANQNPEKQLKACTFAKQSVCASKYVKVSCLVGQF